jgi:hypothetical protein
VIGGSSGVIGLTLGACVLGVSALDRRLELAQRRREVRAGELLERLAGVVVV